MKQLPAFCIDRTEVSRASYARWLASRPHEAATEECAWNDSLVPAVHWPPVGEEALLPVVGVDWCDAAAYCRDAGKVLCGHPDGSAAEWEEPDDSAASAWFAACSSGGEHTFTYGDVYDPSLCGVFDNADACDDRTCEVAVSGSYPSCQSPDGKYLNVMDLTGNVREWENACETTKGEDDRCRARGGSVHNRGDYVACARVLEASDPTDARRGDANEYTGFRCCAPIVASRVLGAESRKGEGR